MQTAIYIIIWACAAYAKLKLFCSTVKDDGSGWKQLLCCRRLDRSPVSGISQCSATLVLLAETHTDVSETDCVYTYQSRSLLSVMQQY